MLKSTKNNLIINNAIELGENISLEDKGKGRHFTSRFIEAGLAHYQEFGDVLITKETLDKFVYTMVGCPVIIRHKDITKDNVDKERVGVVSKVWYNPEDAWYYCSGIIWDKQAIDLIKNQGWSVSCTYDFESDFKKGTYHGKDYDMEFTGGEFLHLALVDNPRYERANIVVNSKDEEFITIGKGENARHIPLDYLLQKNEKFEVDVKGITLPQMNNIIFIGRSIEKLNNITELYKKEQLLLQAPTKNAVKEKIIEIANIAKENLNKNIPENSKTGEYLKNIISNAENYFLNEKAARELEMKSNASFESYINSIIKNILGHKRRIEVASKDGYTYNIEIKKEEKNNIAKFIGNVLEKSKFKPQIIGTFEENELFWLKIEFPKTSNNEGDTTMTVLNELKEFIQNVVNNKGDDMEEKEKVDKRDIIREIMAIAGKEEASEDVKTIAKLAEKLAYDKSEAGTADNKCKNEEDEEKEEKFEEEKEIANKAKNEEEKKEDKEEKAENEEEDKEEEKKADNKCKNSLDETRKIVFGGKQVENECKYVPISKRIEMGNQY